MRLEEDDADEGGGAEELEDVDGAARVRDVVVVVVPDRSIAAKAAFAEDGGKVLLRLTLPPSPPRAVVLPLLEWLDEVMEAACRRVEM